MNTATSTREFLRDASEAFRSLGGQGGMYEFVFDHGLEMFSPRSLPRTYRCFKGEKKMCFRNAAMAAMVHNSLIYCEGYASHIIPVLHAWCLDPHGRVLELTWDKPAPDYFGIPFRMGFLRNELIRNGNYGLLDQMRDHFALVRGKYPKSDWWEERALTRLSAASTVNKKPRGQAGA